MFDIHPDQEPRPRPRAYRPLPRYTQYHYALVGFGVLVLLIVAAIWVL
jgi:hypothetical protein